MFGIFNHYSFIIFALLLLAAVGFLAWKILPWRMLTVLMAVLLIALVAFQYYSSAKINSLETASQLDEVLMSGDPVVLYLYSDY